MSLQLFESSRSTLRTVRHLSNVIHKIDRFEKSREELQHLCDHRCILITQPTFFCRLPLDLRLCIYLQCGLALATSTVPESPGFEIARRWKCFIVSPNVAYAVVPSDTFWIHYLRTHFFIRSSSLAPEIRGMLTDAALQKISVSNICI